MAVAFLVVCAPRRSETTIWLQNTDDRTALMQSTRAELLISSSRRGEKQTVFQILRRFLDEFLQKRRSDLSGQWQAWFSAKLTKNYFQAPR